YSPSHAHHRVHHASPTRRSSDLGKSSSFDVAQDSVVRVYIHKLRRRLDEFYDGLPAAPASRLVIPKGEYRLTIERAEVPVAATPDRKSTRLNSSHVKISYAVFCL